MITTLKCPISVEWRTVELSAANHVEDSAGLIMVTSRATRITLVTRYLIGRLTCERHEREFCTRPVKITELEKGRWSWISNCSEAFHTDSWLAEANPGHSDRDAILKALLPQPAPNVVSTLKSSWIHVATLSTRIQRGFNIESITWYQLKKCYVVSTYSSQHWVTIMLIYMA